MTTTQDEPRQDNARTPPPVRRVVIAGTGTIGPGCATRYLAHGCDVVATGPAPGALNALRSYTGCRHLGRPHPGWLRRIISRAGKRSLMRHWPAIMATFSLT
jgi:hypothetical protein